MAESAETPEGYERRNEWDEVAWQCEVLAVLRRIRECLERAPWMQALPVVIPDTPELRSMFTAERELPVEEELPTWILTDEAVSRVEEAIEQEQRVRGRAYGG